MQFSTTWIVFTGAILAVGCLTGGVSTPQSGSNIQKQSFGNSPDGAPVDIYTLKNAKGMEARITNYGGIVVSLRVPDRKGVMADVVHGFDTAAEYKNSPYFGCLVGRYGNRIAKGKFTLDGKEYTLAINNPPNALHGGNKGFDKVVWTARPLQGKLSPSLELHYLSKDGEEGYPGNLDVTAVYTLTEDNGLRLEYTARTDKPTVVNLTQHTYFNLAAGGDILGHEVQINADTFTPVDSDLITTGELRPVKGTPLDFTRPMAIGARINQEDEQLRFGKGYDHNWVLKRPAGQLAVIARVVEPKGGRILEVLSTEPGLQFYTGNFLDGTLKGKGRVYQFRSGLCMEPQHFPDSPNRLSFPSVVLRPGQVYSNTIVYRFSTK
jgi:aldose 1-epimerase